jgi:hypothetical protein
LCAGRAWRSDSGSSLSSLLHLYMTNCDFLPSGAAVQRLVRDALGARTRAHSLALHDHCLSGEAGRQAADAASVARIALRLGVAELSCALGRLTLEEIKRELESAYMALSDLDQP